MSNNINYSRRQFLQHSMLGTAAAAFPGLLLAADSGKITRTATPGFTADVEIEFVAQAAQVNIFSSGPATQVQKFIAALRKGPSNTLTQLPGNYLGPILTFQQGQKVRVFFNNKLKEPSIIHWHGLHVPQHSDGHPMYSINTGEQFVYEFEVLNRAGTSFYHSHSHDLTAEQVYRGLAGLIVVNDSDEAKLELPGGEYDLPFVIQDRSFDSQNQLQYLHAMPERIMGFLGSDILVNGKPNAEFAVKSRAYRFRAANGSNSRIYKLGWEDGTPLTAIGTDAGLLAKPETRPYIMLAPGERVDLWLDFSGRKVGSQLMLYSLPFSGVMPGMYDRMHGDGRGMGMMHNRLPQGGKFPIAVFKISEKVSESPKLPEKLVPFLQLTERDVDNAANPLPIAISMQHMKPLLNGKSFAMDRVMDFEKVALGSIKKIKIFHDRDSAGQHAGGMGMMGGMQHGNNEHDGESGDHKMGGMGMGGMGGGMMMEMAHPIHLHGQQYQILSRSTAKVKPKDYATVKDGFIDSGWKDTVLVMPGETVEIVKPFQDYKGLFLYHCHNLEHEDLGMMRQFYIG
ncbi:Multicopper oxidase [Methylomonas albis]|uniref:Multicopper oxidase CueO n=1 Tax=Methylomonas albis TaxID=1854563 RepID=A0ABR9D6Q6_9GAMM|nr:multicopper oxidase domain-containing protein [Methylomonas albis]MBD9358491.1 multicopper oxidase domain-containing protein [Methylomonas albis]CAD6881903.1 Multicopper oxidase [Methylomonas albis]